MISQIQIYENQNLEYRNIEHLYKVLKVSHEEVSNSYSQLKEKEELMQNEIEEKSKRVNELISENENLKDTLEQYKKFSYFTGKEKAKIENSYRNIDIQICQYEKKLNEKNVHISKLNSNIKNLSDKIASMKYENEKKNNELNLHIQKLENKISEYTAETKNKIKQNLQSFVDNIYQNNIKLSYLPSNNSIQIKYLGSIIGDVKNSSDEYVSPVHKRDNSVALNKYFSSSSSSGLSKNHITFLSNVDNNTFMVVSKESKNNSEISVSHFDSAERNEDYLIKSIDNFTLSSSYNDNKLSINSHYENDPLNEEVKNINSTKSEISDKKCYDCILF